MKKVVLFSAASIFILIFSVTAVHAQDYLMLQKECDKAAKEYVSDVKVAFTYRSHYNKKLDKCFVRVDYLEDKTTGKRATIAVSNVFERIVVAGYDDTSCFVGAKRCETSNEFEKLIKPYMEQ